jgi:hypothetical protein
MCRLGAILFAVCVPNAAWASGFPDYPGIVWAENDANLIHLANRDGTNHVTFAATNPHAVAMGPHPIPEAHTLYWSELIGGSSKIRKAALPETGNTVTSPQDLILGAAAFAMVVHPSTWDIYWCDAITHKIHRAENDGSGAVQLITLGSFCLGLDIDPVGGKSTGANSRRIR